MNVIKFVEESSPTKITRVYPNRRKKIETIESELFRRCMEDELDTGEMLEVLQVFEKNQNQEDLIAIKESTSGFFNHLIGTSFTLVAIAIIISFISYLHCGNSQSPWCQSARIIPESIFNTFREPPKSKVLPPNLP